MSLFRLAATPRLSVSRAASSSLIRSTPSTPALRVAGRALQSRAKYATSAKALTSTANSSSQVGKSLAVNAEEELRKHAAAWPSWLPKPTVYAAAEQRNWQEESEQRQQDSKTVAQAEASKSESAVAEASATSPEPSGGPHPEEKQQQKQEQQERDWSYWTPPPRPDIELPGPLSRLRAFYRKERGFLIAFVVHVLADSYVSGLETAPFTGRWRYMEHDDAKKSDDKARKSEQRLIAQYQGKMLPNEHPYTLQTKAILNRVLAAARDFAGEGDVPESSGQPRSKDTIQQRKARGRPRAIEVLRTSNWDVKVVNDSEVRACMTYGGQIFITTGMINLMDDLKPDAIGATECGTAASVGTEDRLAYIIGHEVAHRLCEHSREASSSETTFVLAYLAAGLSYFPMPLLFPEFTYALTFLPNSRTCEHEADSVGLTLMAKACFDPREASVAQQRLRVRSLMEEEVALDYAGLPGNGGRAFHGPLLSTHPPSTSRIKKLQEGLPAALEMRKRSGCPDVSTVGNFQRAATQAKQGANAKKQTATLREPSSLGPGGTATASQAPAPAATVVPVAHREMPASTVPQSTPQPARQPAATATVIIEPSQPPSSSPSSLSAQ